jgi:hypothetical protein
MFVTIEGTYIVNPINGNEYHIQLSHPALPDSLILSWFPDGTTVPYVRSQTGWPQATDRNPKGILPIQGSMDRVAPEFQATFLGSQDCCDLFDALLEAQNIASGAVTLIDRFHGNNLAFPVWLQVDQQYRTPYVEGEWWALQFRGLGDL